MWGPALGRPPNPAQSGAGGLSHIQVMLTQASLSMMVMTLQRTKVPAGSYMSCLPCAFTHSAFRRWLPLCLPFLPFLPSFSCLSFLLSPFPVSFSCLPLFCFLFAYLFVCRLSVSSRMLQKLFNDFEVTSQHPAVNGALTVLEGTVDAQQTEKMSCSWDTDSVGLAAETDDTVLGFHAADFWLNICVCHSLIVENKEGADRPTFQVFALHHDIILYPAPPPPATQFPSTPSRLLCCPRTTCTGRAKQKL